METVMKVMGLSKRMPASRGEPSAKARRVLFFAYHRLKPVVSKTELSQHITSGFRRLKKKKVGLFIISNRMIIEDVNC